MDIKIKNNGQARIFRNGVLERLSKTRPWIIYALYIPVCSTMLYYSYAKLDFSSGFIAVLFFLAMLSWTLFEYFTHRYLFHFEASSALGQRLVYIFHGNHHEYPRDKERLFMPPIPSIILAAIVFGFFYAISWLLTGTGIYVFVYYPGFISGYLLYVSMHYAIHTYTPPRFMKKLWRNHLLHHYKYPEKSFGVSTPVWDIIFRTLPPEKE